MYVDTQPLHPYEKRNIRIHEHESAAIMSNTDVGQ